MGGGVFENRESWEEARPRQTPGGRCLAQSSPPQARVRLTWKSPSSLAGSRLQPGCAGPAEGRTPFGGKRCRQLADSGVPPPMPEFDSDHPRIPPRLPGPRKRHVTSRHVASRRVTSHARREAPLRNPPPPRGGRVSPDLSELLPLPFPLARKVAGGRVPQVPALRWKNVEVEEKKKKSGGGISREKKNSQKICQRQF